jgi:hypothetical protein
VEREQMRMSGPARLETRGVLLGGIHVTDSVGCPFAGRQVGLSVA